MAQNALLQIRIDEELKNEADTLFADLGFDTPTAVRIFLKKAVQRQGMPFDVAHSMPNIETIAAMVEAEMLLNDPNTKTYTNFSELRAEIEEEMRGEV